ncbi:MAG: hypothetical protein RLY31_1242 [Bacteroidota bacterium]
MKNIRIAILASVLTAFGSWSSLQAQKFGHLNSGNILVLLPGTKAADAQLKVFQDSLVADGEQLARKLEEDFNTFATQYREGGVTPAEAQQKQAEFQQREAELNALEETIMNQVAQKREELLSPLLDRVQQAINEVGKEGGYNMIFDTSVFNTILFAMDSNDIEPLVKAKLGIE